jgi:hypothetical protein
VKKARTVSQKVRERDRGRCQVPGCSRRAQHGHHIEYRSRGGGDEPANRDSLCAFHHLVGVHQGYLRVSGTAPDRLTWEIGPRHAPIDLRRWLGLVEGAPGRDGLFSAAPGSGGRPGETGLLGATGDRIQPLDARDPMP